MTSAAVALSRQWVVEEGPRLRRLVLAAVVAGVPLFFLRSTNDPFNVPKLALLIAGLSIAGGIRAIETLQGAPAAGLKRLLVPATVVLAPLSLAWIVSPYKYWGLFGFYGRFQGLIPYILVVLLGVLVADAFAGYLRDLAWALTVAGGLAGAYAVLQVVGIDPLSWSQLGGEVTQTSTLGNPNFSGGFLAIVLPVALSLWRAESQRQSWATAALAFTAAGLVVSSSEGAYAAAAAGVLTFAAFVWSSGRQWLKWLSLGAVVAIAVAVLGLVSYAMLNPDDERLPLTTSQRAVWWRGALSMGMDNPLLGRGPNSYAVEGNRYRPVDDGLSHGLDFSDDPHSVPLSFFASAGFLGLLGFLGVGGWAIHRARSVDGADPLQVGLLASVTAYFVQSLVSIDEVALRTVFWAVLGGFAASFVVAKVAQRPPASGKRKPKGAPSAKSKRRPPKPESLRAFPATVAIVLLSLGSVAWSGLFLLNDARIRWGLVAFRSGQPERAQAEFDRSLSFRGDYHFRHLNGFYAGEVAVQHEEDDEDGEAWFTRAREAFGFVDLFPRVPAVVDYARLLDRYSEFDPGVDGEAADLYIRLIELDPYNVATVPEAVRVLSEENRHQDVVEAISPRVEELASGAPVLWAYLSLAYSETGNKEDAVAALTEAEAASVQDPILRKARRALAAD